MLSHLSRPKHVVFNTFSHLLSVSSAQRSLQSDRKTELHTRSPLLRRGPYIIYRVHPMTVLRMECMSENYHYTHNSD